MLIVKVFNKRVKNMQLLLYASVFNEDWVRLGSVVEQSAPREKIEIYRKISALHDRLSRPLRRPAVLVLLAANKNELVALSELATLSYDLKTVLILPDRTIDTVKQGHCLSPSFYTYLDSDFSDLRAVLQHVYESGVGKPHISADALPTEPEMRPSQIQGTS